MPKIVTTTAMLILAGVTGAVAQAGVGGQPAIVQPGAAYTNETTVSPAAPALRQRQPRRSDMLAPTEHTAAQSTVDPDEAALDRKIRNICRGC